MTDFQHTQSDPHGSHRKMLHVLLTHLPPTCALTFLPAPEGQAVKRLRTPPSKVLKEQRYMIRKEGSQNKLQVEKNPRRARVRAETRTYGTDSPSRSKSRALSITPLHYPQKRRLNDGLTAHMIRSTRESSEDVATYTWSTKSMVLMEKLPNRCRRFESRHVHLPFQGFWIYSHSLLSIFIYIYIHIFE